MTTVDGDHFDAFRSLEEYQEAFRHFLKMLPEEGVLITHLSDPDCAAVSRGLKRKILDADALPLPQLKVPGRHMQQNAQLVLALGDFLGVKQATILGALRSYAGCWRRMEVKGEYGEGVTVIDDYGHHPREIRAVLSALKEAYADRRLICVFQPHTQNRTLKLYHDFIAAFADADVVLFTDVYEAREDGETEHVDMETFAADTAKESKVDCRAAGSLSAVQALLTEELLQPGDVLLTLGAGTVTELSDALVGLSC
ncbi:hypothetical protein COU76_01365 [Candidatus Peregrinibacteria bacterium CG10_big_fil_rev_8_21_14_0_10_49_10]|nr:MAG: hypothetical protein COU76_01365 [Candidatus Peregrinibacteria bacterium CG10_big_fil_rev_8_21_14_0_10_49_10]